MTDHKDRDDFWRELMGSDDDSEKPETENPSDNKDDELNSLIEALSHSGKNSDENTQDGEKNISHDDFWDELQKTVQKKEKEGDSKSPDNGDDTVRESGPQKLEAQDKSREETPGQSDKSGEEAVWVPLDIQNRQPTGAGQAQGNESGNASSTRQNREKAGSGPARNTSAGTGQESMNQARQEKTGQPDRQGNAGSPQQNSRQQTTGNTSGEFNAFPQQRNGGKETKQNGTASGRSLNYGESPKSREELMGPDDFDLDFDFDEEYGDVEEKAVRRGRSKRTGCLSGILYFVFIVCISIVIACFLWMGAVDVLGLGSDSSDVTVNITKEMMTTKEKENEDGEIETVQIADIDAVSDMLYDQGLIRYKWLFKIFSSFSSADEKIQTGTYVLNMNFDYRALVNGMTQSGGERVTVDVTIPEGYNSYQIVSLLESEGVCDAEDLWDAMANYEFDYDFLDDSTLGDELRLEGYLFPDTYTFYMGDSASRVINKLLSNFNTKWTEEMQEQADELGYTQYEILIIASMIEKEAGNDEERATIASVIYNRLESNETFGLLQIDATIYYAIAGTDESFSVDLESPYNTYKYAGLTPGPISNPGLASIQAALEPEDTNYYYYALGTDGVHHFFKNYDDHQAFVASDEYGG